jgi:hypothetical protein
MARFCSRARLGFSRGATLAVHSMLGYAGGFVFVNPRAALRWLLALAGDRS